MMKKKQKGIETNLFACRIVNFEYTTVPFSEYVSVYGAMCYVDARASKVTNKSLARVPIVRVFGPASNGQNACVNVHGIYPYFYVDWTNGLNLLFDCETTISPNGLPIAGAPVCDDQQSTVPPFRTLNQLFHAMAILIEQFLVASPKTQRIAACNRGGHSTGLVYNISVVLRRSIYGYEEERRPFLLIELTDIRLVHEAAKCLHSGHFFGLSFQPYEAHLIGLQFLADLNLRGMDYLYVDPGCLVIPDSKSKWIPRIICDVEVNCHRDHILNQYTTVIHPDDNVDNELLIAKSTCFDVTDKRLEIETPGPNGKDPWPADYDDCAAPPVGTSMEVLWNEDNARRFERKEPSALSLYERRKSNSFKRRVHQPTEMMEELHRNLLKNHLEWGRYLPDEHFGTESELLKPLVRRRLQIAQDNAFPSHSKFDPIPNQFVSAYPRFSKPDDISNKKLKGEIAKLHRQICQLPHQSPLRPYGRNIKGLQNIFNNGRLNIGRTFFYCRPTPCLPSTAPSLICRRLKRPRSTLTTNLDTCGRVILDNVRPVKYFRTSHQVISQTQQKCIATYGSSGTTVPEELDGGVVRGDSSDCTNIDQEQLGRSSASPPFSSSVANMANRIPLYEPSVFSFRSASSSAVTEIDPPSPSIPSQKDNNEEVQCVEENNMFKQVEVPKRKRQAKFLELLRKLHCVKIKTPSQVAQIRGKRRPKVQIEVLDTDACQNSSGTSTPPKLNLPQEPSCRDYQSSNSSFSTPVHRLPIQVTPTRDRSSSGNRKKTVDSPGTVRRSTPPKITTNALRQISNLKVDSAQRGLHIGRTLALEVMVDLEISRDSNGQPKSFNQLKRFLLDPQKDRLLGLVYVCRFELSEDLSRNEQVKKITQCVPGGGFTVEGINFSKSIEKGYVDCLGVIYVDECEGHWKTSQSSIAGGFSWTDESQKNMQLRRESIDLKSCVQRFRVPMEEDLIRWTVQQLFVVFDPTLIIGFNTYGDSIGFFVRRATAIGFSNIARYLGRLPPSGALARDVISRKNVTTSTFGGKPSTIVRASGDIMLQGRIVMNLWRLFKSEVKTDKYTIHGLASAILNTTFPHYSRYVLSTWWFATHYENSSDLHHNNESKDDTDFVYPLRFRCVHYLLRYVELSLKLLDSVDLLSRSEELARIFGTDIWSVISRGSQHRVEAMLCRAAHALGYLLHTASKEQIKKQPAVMCLPLVLEPESAFYWWPVVVLDFQSLYPSVIIGYNLCYSTSLGKVTTLWKDSMKNENHNAELDKNIWKPFGVSSVAISPYILKKLQSRVQPTIRNSSTNTNDDEERNERLCINITPDETMYINRCIRRGILPALLEEVISTRVMIKETIKLLKESNRRGDAKLLRLQNHRQFGLKMFANVTYGYTTATYSGRMPCSELADSIVQISRRTLERSISYIQEHPKWNARVVYGDTDSIFILLEGRSVKEAFEVGKDIVNEISALNPWPIELNLEKVYFPCCLQTKKRYVGWSYESPYSAPRLDSKGIEVVRRDQCPIVSKVLREGLISLFTTRDISKTKAQLQDCWTQMLLGEPHSSFNDLLFMRELKFGSYAYNRDKPAHTLPPQAVVSYANLYDWKTSSDDKDGGCDSFDSPIFEYGTRITYLTASGPPGSRLIDEVVSPYRAVGGSAPVTPLCPITPKADSSPYRLWCGQYPLNPNTDWYIMKQIIPVLQRMFCLIGPSINVKQWYEEMKKPNIVRQPHPRYIKEAVPSPISDHPLFTYRAVMKRPRVQPSTVFLSSSAVTNDEHDHEIIDITDLENNEIDQLEPDLCTTSFDETFVKMEDGSQKDEGGIQVNHTEQSDPKVQEEAGVDRHKEPDVSAARDVRFSQRALEELLGIEKDEVTEEVTMPSEAKSSWRRDEPPVAALGNIPTLFNFIPSASYPSCRCCGSLTNRISTQAVRPTTTKSIGLASERQQLLNEPINGREQNKRANVPLMLNPSPLGKEKCLSSFWNQRTRALSKLAKEGLPGNKDDRVQYRENDTDTLQSKDSLSTEANEELEAQIVEELEKWKRGNSSIEEPINDTNSAVMSLRTLLCLECIRDTRQSIWKIQTRLNRSEVRVSNLNRICVHCTGNRFGAAACTDAFHCKIYPKRIKAQQQLELDIEDLQVLINL